MRTITAPRSTKAAPIAPPIRKLVTKPMPKAPAPVAKKLAPKAPAPVAKPMPKAPAPVAKKLAPKAPAPVAKKLAPKAPAPVAKKLVPKAPAPAPVAKPAPRAVAVPPAPPSTLEGAEYTALFRALDKTLAHANDSEILGLPELFEAIPKTFQNRKGFTDNFNNFRKLVHGMGFELIVDEAPAPKSKKTVKVNKGKTR
jgi:hypothetical protein